MPSLRGLARRLLRPLDGRIADINRRVTDARGSIEAVSESIEELGRELGAYSTTATESNSYVGVEIRRLQGSTNAVEASLAELDERVREHEQRVLSRIDTLDRRAYAEHLDSAARAPLEQLDGAVANLLNYANGHRGFAAQAGLWFNPPMNVELGAGEARLASVNERIAEMPYALAALGRLRLGARVLEVGSAESTFALSAASLGYEVTAVDLHPLPYSHPNIESVVGRFEDFQPEQGSFDAAFLISTIEHFGLGAYGERKVAVGADRRAIERIGELLSDDGLLVLTTPYGAAGVNELERTYDEDTLAELLDGWSILDRLVLERHDELTWIPAEPGAPPPQDGLGVVMVTAALDRSA